MLNNENKAQGEVAIRPTILKVLIVLACVQLLVVIGLLIAEIVLKYLGLGQDIPLELSSSCTDAYTVTKYRLALNENVTVRFLATCWSVLLGLILLILIIRALALPPPGAEAREDPQVLLADYVGWGLCRVWYILQSLGLLGVIVNFGFYLGVYLKGKSQCSWKQYRKNQLLILWCIAGGLLIVGIVVWLIIVYIIFKRNQVEEQRQKYEEENEATPEGGSKKGGSRQGDKDERPKEKHTSDRRNQQETYATENDPDRKKSNHQKTRKRSDEQEMTPYSKHRGEDTPSRKGSQQEDQNIWVGAPQRQKELQRQKEEERKRQELWKKDQPARQESEEIPNYSPKKHEDNRAHLLDKYGDSDPKKRSKAYDPPRSQEKHEKQYPHSSNKSPRMDRQSIYDPPLEKTPNKSGSRFPSNPQERDRNLSRNRLHEEEQSYLAENSNRKILPSEGAYEGQRPKLHSTYFREETAQLKKDKFDESSGKKPRRGILTEYIRGKYVS